MGGLGSVLIGVSPVFTHSANQRFVETRKSVVASMTCELTLGLEAVMLTRYLESESARYSLGGSDDV